MKYVTAAFIFYKGRLLIVFHKKLNIWLHVGGHVEKDETFEEALLREIKEEVNLSVKIYSPYSIKNDNNKFDSQPFYVHYGNERGVRKTWLDFLCVANDISTLKIKRDELEKYKWVNKTEFKKLDTFPLVKELGLLAFEKLKPT